MESVISLWRQKFNLSEVCFTAWNISLPLNFSQLLNEIFKEWLPKWVNSSVESGEVTGQQIPPQSSRNLNMDSSEFGGEFSELTTQACQQVNGSVDLAHFEFHENTVSSISFDRKFPTGCQYHPQNLNMLETPPESVEVSWNPESQWWGIYSTVQF